MQEGLAPTRITRMRVVAPRRCPRCGTRWAWSHGGCVGQGGCPPRSWRCTSSSGAGRSDVIVSPCANSSPTQSRSTAPTHSASRQRSGELAPRRTSWDRSVADLHQGPGKHGGGRRMLPKGRDKKGHEGGGGGAFSGTDVIAPFNHTSVSVSEAGALRCTHVHGSRNVALRAGEPLTASRLTVAAVARAL